MSAPIILLPCPFCGLTPDPEASDTFQEVDSAKLGAVVCCCHGPDIRTGYNSVDKWKADAAEAWNTRVPAQVSEDKPILPYSIIFLYRYIPFTLLPKAVLAGWMLCNALVGTHHGDYAVLCEWLCDCPEPWPL